MSGFPAISKGGFILVFVIAIAFFLSSPDKISAATRTWDGGGGDDNWSTCANWDGPDTCPTSSDVATFNTTSTDNATIDAGFAGSVSGINIQSGYTGTITQARTLTIGSGNYAQADGTFTGATQTITINSGSFTLTGGVFTSTSGTFSIARNFSKSGSSTFTANGGTVAFVDAGGTDDSTITCTTAVTFNTVSITKDNAGALVVGADCIVPLGASPTSSFNADNFTNNGTITVASGTWTIGGSGGGNPNTIFTNNGTITHSGSGWIIGGDFTNGSSGVVTYSGSTLTVYANFNISQGTFPSGLTVSLLDNDSNDDATLTCGSVTFTQVIITKDNASDLIISSDCTVPMGASPTSAFNAAGLTNNGVITVASGTWTINGSGGGNPNTTFTNNGTITHSGSGWIIRGNFTNGSSGVVTYSGSTLTVEASLDVSQGTFPSGLTVTFSSSDSNDHAVITCGSVTFTQVIITKSSAGNLTIGSDCVFPLGASPSSPINASTLTNNGTITIASGTWTISGANPGNGSVINNGTITHSGSGWVNHNAFTNGSSGIVTYSGTTLTNWGALTVSQGTFPSGLSLTMGSDDDSDDTTLTCGSVTFTDITINRAHGSADFTLGSDCTMSGNFTRTDGRVTNPSSAYTLSIAGNMSISTTDTFGGANLTMEFTGSSNQTITQNAGTFSAKYKVNKSIGNKVTQTTNLTLGNTFDVTSGTHDQGATFNLTTGGATTIGASGTWINTGTGDIILAGDVSNSGVITLDGSGVGCGGADAIAITSTSGQRTWSGSGTISPVYDAAITNQGGSVTAMSSTDNGGNGWTISSTCNTNPNAPSSLGPAGYVDGSWDNDNTPTLTFSLSDPDGSDTVKFQIQIDDTSNFSSPVVDYTSALAAQGSFSFTVGQAAGGGSYTTGSGGQTLSDSSGYYWRVKTIDNSAAESAYSTANSGAIAFKVDTAAPTTGSLSVNTRTTSSITVEVAGASDSLSGLSATPYNFSNTTASTSSGAQAGTTWQSNSLSINTEYTFQVTVTDVAGNSASSATFDAFTLANPPSNLILTADGTTQITASWQVNGNPAGTEFFAENTTASTNSGWVADAVSWISSGLNPATVYTFSIKARNGDGVETSSIIDDQTTQSSPRGSSSGNVKGGDKTKKESPEFKLPVFELPLLKGLGKTKEIKKTEEPIIPEPEPTLLPVLEDPETQVISEPEPTIEEPGILEEIVDFIGEIIESAVELVESIVEIVASIASSTSELFLSFVSGEPERNRTEGSGFSARVFFSPTSRMAGQAFEAARIVVNKPAVKTIGGAAVVIPVTTSVAILFAPIASGVPVANHLTYLFIFTAQLLGLRKNSKPWGTVYDRVTKEPISFARVEILNKEGRKLDTTVTDSTGRYGFLVSDAVLQSSAVRLHAYKDKYVFPAEKSYSELEQLIYPNTYHGELLATTTVTNFDLPMEPMAKSSRASFYPKILSPKFNNILAGMTNVAFTIGAVFALTYLSVNPGAIGIVLVAVIAVSALLRKSGFALKPFGLTKDIAKGRTMPFSFIDLHNSVGERVNFTVSDDQGRYFMLVSEGKYQLKASTPAHISPPRTKEMPISAKGGWVSREIRL